MPTERPILLPGPKVRAILDGRKSQMRRVVKPQPGTGAPVSIGGWGDGVTAFEPGQFGVYRKGTPIGQWGLERVIRSPLGQSGDLLYVKEAWCDISGPGPSEYPTIADGPLAVYRADDETAPFKWSSSVHMPRWACRLWLRVTGVRVERLQEISEIDAEREASGEEIGIGIWAHPEHGDTREPKLAFRWGWDPIHKPGERWANNPFVWIIEFERTEAPSGI